MDGTLQSNESRQRRLSDRAFEIATLLLPAAVFGIPLASNTVAESGFVSLTLILGVILILMLLAATAALVFGRRTPPSPALLAGMVLPAAMWVSVAVSPSSAGLILTVFASGALGVLLTMTLLDRHHLATKVTLPLLLTSAIQGVLIIIQTITDRAIGLTLLDGDAELRFIDGLLRSPGTMHHVYEPAALALSAAGLGIVTAGRLEGPMRWLWSGAVGIAGATIGLTHSRSALLGLLLMAPLLVLAVRKNREVRMVTASLLVGFTVAALLTSSAWLLRGDQSVSGDLDDMSLGRVTLIRQAATIAVDHPLLGVGPGRYLDAMEAEYELDPDYPFIVHNVSLAIAAENGIPAALIVTALIGWAVLRAFRGEAAVAAVALSITGFLVFDVLHYNRPVGLLLTAIWLGTLHVFERDERSAVRR